MQKIVETLYRDVQISALNTDKRTVELSFSSETREVEREFGIEILDHSPGSVRMDRLHNGAPLLVDHDVRDVVGVVDSATITNKRGVATVRFGKGSRASEIWQDVKDGIRSTVSISYKVFKATLESTSDDGIQTYRIMDWMPLEISLVSVPADGSVGIGRSQGETNTLEIDMPEETTTRSERRRSTSAGNEELERVQDMRAIGEKFGHQELAEDYIRGNASVELLRDHVLKNMKSIDLRGVGPDREDIGLTGPEARGYSFCKAIAAMADPPNASRIAGFELEVSVATEKQFHITRNGFHVPPDVLRQVTGQRDLVAGTASAGGDLVATDLLTGSFIDLLRNASVIKSAGATVLTGLVGNVAVPRQTDTSTAFWVAEGAAATESQLVLDQLLLSPSSVGAFTDFSRKLILQASLDIEQLVRRDLATTLAIEIDRVAIEGSGSGAEPQGIIGTTGVGAVVGGTNGGAPTHAHMVELESDVAIPNALTGSLAYITNATAVGTLKQVLLDSGSGRFLLEDNRMNGYQVFMSNNVPADLTQGSGTDLSAIIFGDWSSLVIGEWGGLSLLVDPYTFSTTGSVRVVAFQDVDIGLRHVASFSVMADAITA